MLYRPGEVLPSLLPRVWGKTFDIPYSHRGISSLRFIPIRSRLHRHLINLDLDQQSHRLLIEEIAEQVCRAHHIISLQTLNHQPVSSISCKWASRAAVVHGAPRYPTFLLFVSCSRSKGGVIHDVIVSSARSHRSSLARRLHLYWLSSSREDVGLIYVMAPVICCRNF